VLIDHRELTNGNPSGRAKVHPIFALDRPVWGLEHPIDLGSGTSFSR
jgi:hypothetical protein